VVVGTVAGSWPRYRDGMTTSRLDVELLLAGDPRMAKLFLAVLRRRCQRYFRSPQEVESAAAEAIVELLTKLAGGQQPEHAKIWAITAASNAARRMLNRRRRMDEFDSAVHFDLELTSISEIQRCWVLLDHVDGLLETMPETIRAAMIATAVDGRTIESVARELGVPAGTLRKSLVRTRQKFKGELSKGEKRERLLALARQARQGRVEAPVRREDDSSTGP
jgi:RNA polymerase sigma factor (sigma-70 family)